MATAKHHVWIKGVKDGLVFVLDDSCPFDKVIEELQHKLDKTNQQIFSGPDIEVTVSLGERQVDQAEEELIRQIIQQQGNLRIKSIKTSADQEETKRNDAPKLGIQQGIVRSGQVLTYEGNLLFLGDVNPGGSIICSGDIYIMGSLRGMAHAGVNGNLKSIISASLMRPTQLRIAHVISRPPDEWAAHDTYMEFAYIKDGNMEIDKIVHLSKVRPDLST